jgi:hypothetical protein
MGLGTLIRGEDGTPGGLPRCEGAGGAQRLVRTEDAVVRTEDAVERCFVGTSFFFPVVMI